MNTKEERPGQTASVNRSARCLSGEPKYILSVLSQGRFEADLSFKISETRYSARAVIDTGCYTSMVSANLIFRKESIHEIEDAEISYYLNHQKPFIRAFGVTDIKKEEVTNYAAAKGNPTIRFPRMVQGIEIDTYPIGDGFISLSYGTKDIALIGMNLLRELLSYIGSYKDDIYYLAARRGDKEANEIFTEALQKML